MHNTPLATIISCAAALPAAEQTRPVEHAAASVFDDGIPSQQSRVWRLLRREDISHLMTRSLHQALQQAGMRAADIDYVIVSLVWAENLMEQEVVNFVRDSDVSCPVLTVNAGTAGGLAAMELAAGLAGRYPTIAVISACCYAHNFADHDPAKALLSDGATCLIMGAGQGAEILNFHTLSTRDYVPLSLQQGGPKWTVAYSRTAGQYLIENYPLTFQRALTGLCEKSAIAVNDIAHLHVYDPTSWITARCAQQLRLDNSRFTGVFHRYGSLGPGQHLLAFITMADNPLIRDGDNVVLYGFAPASVAVAVLLRFNRIPVSLTHYSF